MPEWTPALGAGARWRRNIGSMWHRWCGWWGCNVDLRGMNLDTDVWTQRLSETCWSDGVLNLMRLEDPPTEKRIPEPALHRLQPQVCLTSFTSWSAQKPLRIEHSKQETTLGIQHRWILHRPRSTQTSPQHQRKHTTVARLPLHRRNQSHSPPH